MLPHDDHPPIPQVAQAITTLRRNIPAGSNAAIIAALDTLAQHGDESALTEVEAWLGSHALAESYGDRDDDPPDWKLDRRAFALLVRWWERLELLEARGAQLATDWLGDGRYFGSNGFDFFTQIAPTLAAYIAPLLLAQLDAADPARRKRAVDGLGYAPTQSAVAALIALLGDADEPVPKAARWALQRLAARPEVAGPIIDALGSPEPLVRAGALQSLAWFSGYQHRNSIRFPVLFERAFAAIAPLLADADVAVQRVAAERIDAAGYHLDMLRLSGAQKWGVNLPPLDLLPLLEHAQPAVVRAAIYLAGRCGEAGDPPRQSALAMRIIALLDRLRSDYLTYKAALYALARLRAVAAIPLIAPHLDAPRDAHYVDAALVLGRLGHAPVIPHLLRLLNDLTYRDDAHEALYAFESASVLPLLNARLDAWRSGVQQYVALPPVAVPYLEAHGDSESLALLRQTASYYFAARYIGAERDPLVEAARSLDRRLLAEAGLDPQAIDDPVAAVRRILGGPVHPAECVVRDLRGELLPDGEQRARWRNLCVALAGWLRAEPPELEAALDEAERLLADFPDALREAHEAWWLDVARGGQLGLPAVSAVARAALHPRAPWRLARALVINEGLQHSLDPALCLGWPGLASLQILELPLDVRWLQALVHAPPHVAPRRLRVLLGGDSMAETLAQWPGIERLEELEVVWSRGLSAAGRAALEAHVRVRYL